MQGCCHIAEKTEPPINKCFHLLRVGTHCVHGGVGGNGGRPVCHGGPGTSVARIVHHCFELPAEDLSLLCPAFGSNASGAVTRWHTAGGPTMSAHPPEQFLFPVSPRACLIQRPVHGPTDFTLDLAAHPRDPRVRGRTVPPPISGRGHCVRHVLWCPFSDQTNSDCSSTIKVRR